MSKQKKLEHVLDNGYTFLAVTSGMYGYWAKAKDPITAAMNAAANAGDKEHIVRVIYAKNETAWVDDFGSITYSLAEPPVAIGLWIVKWTSRGRTVRPATDKDKSKTSSDQWVNDFNSDLAEQVAEMKAA